jgi:hypothetical protein
MVAEPDNDVGAALCGVQLLLALQTTRHNDVGGWADGKFAPCPWTEQACNRPRPLSVCSE